MKGVIISADDFGADLAVNEAVERAHREGVLTAASLMINGAAVEDAIERARKMPGLGVGLHIVLTDGVPVLPHTDIPALAGKDGRFHNNMVLTAMTIAAFTSAKAQLKAEVEAQFEAFAKTGLPLDHVNTHKHFHLHPHIAQTIIEVGKRYGMKAMRVPKDRRSSVVMELLSSRLSRQLKNEGILGNRQVFGLAATGNFDKKRMRRVLRKLPEGLTELYFHPATLNEFPGSVPSYRYRDELEALLDPAVADALKKSPAVSGNFRSFFDPKGADWHAFAAAADMKTT